MPVKGEGVLVLGVDNEREGLGVALEHTERGIRQQRASEPLVVEVSIDGETADERRGQDRVAWQAFQRFRRQIARRNARCRERVVSGERLRLRFHDDEATRHEPLHIL